MIYFIGAILIIAAIFTASLYAIAAGSMYHPGRDLPDSEYLYTWKSEITEINYIEPEEDEDQE